MKWDKLLQSKRVLVVGDLIKDVHLYGTIERMSPEAPVPIISIKDKIITPGGAGNVWRQLKEVVQTDFVYDLETEKKPQFSKIKNYGNSSIKTRVIVGNQHQCRLDDDYGMEGNFEGKLSLQDYDVVVLSDYDKGVISKFLEVYDNQFETTTIITNAKRNLQVFENSDIAICNRAELKELFSWVGNKFHLRLPKKFYVTDAENPVTEIISGDTFDVPKIKVVDISGAGDSFVVGVVLSHLFNEESPEFGIDLASQVIQRSGVAMLKKSEIKSLVENRFPNLA
jgi:bifunctional ADP-heptose synthase (sugar kinase/adenylyltransferase)